MRAQVRRQGEIEACILYVGRFGEVVVLARDVGALFTTERSQT